MSAGRSGGHLQPDAVSYGFVALAHFRAGRSFDGLEVLFACAQVLQPATAAVYAQCMAVAVSAGDAPAAMALWRDMATLGVQPDDACRCALIAAAPCSRVPGSTPSPTDLRGTPVATAPSHRHEDLARMLRHSRARCRSVSRNR